MIRTTILLYFVFITYLIIPGVFNFFMGVWTKRKFGGCVNRFFYILLGYLGTAVIVFALNYVFRNAGILYQHKQFLYYYFIFSPLILSFIGLLFEPLVVKLNSIFLNLLSSLLVILDINFSEQISVIKIFIRLNSKIATGNNFSLLKTVLKQKRKNYLNFFIKLAQEKNDYDICEELLSLGYIQAIPLAIKFLTTKPMDYSWNEGIATQLAKIYIYENLSEEMRFELGKLRNEVIAIQTETIERVVGTTKKHIDGYGWIEENDYEYEEVETVFTLDDFIERERYKAKQGI